MTTIPLQQAQANLVMLIHGLGPDDEVVITENNEPVARIISTAPHRRVRRLGTMAGSVLQMAEDFDEPLDEFQEYST